MKKISDTALAFWVSLLGKLSQRSTVFSVVPMLAALGLQFDQSRMALILQTVCGVATGLLFLLNDPQVRYLLTGKMPAPPAPTVPDPLSSDKS